MIDFSERHYDEMKVIKATSEEIKTIDEAFCHTGFKVTKKLVDDIVTYYSEEWDGGVFGTLDLSLDTVIIYTYQDDIKWTIHHPQEERITTINTIIYALWGKWIVNYGFDQLNEALNSGDCYVFHIEGDRLEDIIKKETNLLRQVFNYDEKRLKGMALFTWGKCESLSELSDVSETFFIELENCHFQNDSMEKLVQGCYGTPGNRLMLSVFANYTIKPKEVPYSIAELTPDDTGDRFFYGEHPKIIRVDGYDVNHYHDGDIPVYEIKDDAGNVIGIAHSTSEMHEFTSGKENDD